MPGEGPIDPRAMLIGEAPGRTEDATGRPFMGFSGRFLNEVLAEVGIKREEIFITSSIKCLPVPTGKPQLVSIEACNPWLQAQLGLVNPRFICLIGGVAAKTVLGMDKVSEFRGKIVERDGRIILPTFHPAAARRFPKLGKLFREDFRLMARYTS